MKSHFTDDLNSAVEQLLGTSTDELADLLESAGAATYASSTSEKCGLFSEVQFSGVGSLVNTGSDEGAYAGSEAYGWLAAHEFPQIGHVVTLSFSPAVAEPVEKTLVSQEPILWLPAQASSNLEFDQLAA